MFRVTHLPNVGLQIRQLADQAPSSEVRQRILDAVKAILSHLENRPLEWGDPDYRAKKEGGLICHGIEHPLISHFVVYEAEKVVCILSLEALP